MDLRVKDLLGYRNITETLVYAHRVYSESYEHNFTIAEKDEEADGLVMKQKFEEFMEIKQDKKDISSAQRAILYYLFQSQLRARMMFLNTNL